MAGITMNTGEGGYPKYHLMEEADLIFQMGTAKFGVRTKDGALDPDLLREVAEKPQVKMIEIKFSQGAKPGKGGLLPKEKITPEIADLRKVSPDEDVISPPYHESVRICPPRWLSSGTFSRWFPSPSDQNLRWILCRIAISDSRDEETGHLPRLDYH